MIVDIHSTVRSISLSHHIIAFKAIIDLSLDDGLELLLEKYHILVDGEVLSLILLVLIHAIHVVHGGVEATNIVDWAHVVDHHHVLVDSVNV